MNNYDEKILTIKETEKQLLSYAKSKISENNDIFNEIRANSSKKI